MFYARWLLTFVGFPLGGFVAVHTVGSVDGPVTGALAGAVAGSVIGVGQWLALRSRGIGPRWAIGTAAAMAVGSGIAAALTGAGTSVGALVVTGAVAGAAVGIAQGVVLDRGAVTTAWWAVVVSGSWAVGWLITANVIVDADRGYVAFGSSGAVVATVVTGLALGRLLGDRRRSALSAAPAPAHPHPDKPAAR